MGLLSVTTMDQFVETKLRAWGYKSLIPKFNAKKIDKGTFLELTQPSNRLLLSELCGKMATDDTDKPLSREICIKIGFLESLLCFIRPYKGEKCDEWDWNDGDKVKDIAE